MAISKSTKGVRAPRTSVSHQVEDHIRQAVYKGLLHPRERIIEDDVARRLRVSRGSVREALLRLERDGLVVTTPRRGTYIRGISPHEFKAIFGMRGKLEGLCVRYMREAMKPEIQTALNEALRKMKSAASSLDDEKFFYADMELHQAVWKASGQPQLFRTLNLVMTPFIFMIARNYSAAQPISARYEDHVRYLDTILNSSPGRVEREVERYFDRLCKQTFPHLLSSLGNPDDELLLHQDISGQYFR
jgi:DNA-binding GntR family transcriptional regulator